VGRRPTNRRLAAMPSLMPLPWASKDGERGKKKKKKERKEKKKKKKKKKKEKKKEKKKSGFTKPLNFVTPRSKRRANNRCNDRGDNNDSSKGMPRMTGQGRNQQQ
jgi:hypothetical protein